MVDLEGGYNVKPVQAIDHWFTLSEWGTDGRTGAIVTLKERDRRSGDRPGKSTTVWEWTVYVRRAPLKQGHAQNQGGARRAVREIVRALPDQETQ